MYRDLNINAERGVRMEDIQILNLYLQRSEIAISETEKKYGRYCYKIAKNILHIDEDAEECVNDSSVFHRAA